jgi:hypothetical protein
LGRVAVAGIVSLGRTSMDPIDAILVAMIITALAGVVVALFIY